LENKAANIQDDNRSMDKKGKEKAGSARMTRNDTAWHARVTTARSAIWYFDSGASRHMSADRSQFVDLDTTDRREVELANGTFISVAGTGICRVPLSNGRDLELLNALYVPSLAANLLSVRQLDHREITVEFENGKAIVRKGGREVGYGELNGNDYVLKRVSQARALAVRHKPLRERKDDELSSQEYSELMHRRLSHNTIICLQYYKTFYSAFNRG
jgi:hypothetical protein